MRWSMIISFVVHASILLAAVIVLPEPDKYLAEEQESIPVEIIEFSQITKKVASTKSAKEDPVKKPLPPKPKEVEVVKEKEPVKPAEEVKKAAKEPEPEPVPDPVKELIEKVEKQPEPEPEPKPEPKKAEAVAKPVPLPRSKPKVPKSFKTAQKKKKKHKFDPNELSVLLNKIDEDRTAPPEQIDEIGTPATNEIANIIGRDQQASASLAQWLGQKAQQCWSPPIGVRGAENLRVSVVFSLDISGTVTGAPVVTNSSSNPLFQVAAAAAVRAVLGCQPYDGLPVDRYNEWTTNKINFDPSRMLAVN